MLFLRRAPAATRRAPDAPPARCVVARGALTVLRELEREDVDRWLEWPPHRDPLFESYNPPSLNLRQREAYYRERVTALDARQYAVDDLEGRLVGRISLREADWRLGAAVLGMSFHPERLGRGLGTDALRAFLGHYFGPLRMRALFLDVAAFNFRARRVYEKCGFHGCSQHWGDAQADTAGIFRKAELAALRPYFRLEYGLVRPLVIDMVTRQGEWQRRRDEWSGLALAGR